MSLVSGDVKIALLAFCGLVAICSLSLGDVVINEAELSPSDNGTVWVELYNAGDGAVDLAGWTVKIEDKPWAGSIALSGTIDPKGFKVAEGQPSWVTSGNGTVYLIDINGIVVDKTPKLNDKGHNDFTYGRFPDGRNTNTKADFFFMRASKGRPNGV
ncbi:MAG: lamin tail domain-containing protein [Methanothrix sp.]|nr:lamin tail domain-containing protein [Methanothrix sp.]